MAIIRLLVSLLRHIDWVWFPVTAVSFGIMIQSVGQISDPDTAKPGG